MNKNKLTKRERALCILTGICLGIAMWAAIMLYYAAFGTGPEILEERLPVPAGPNILSISQDRGGL